MKTAASTQFVETATATTVATSMPSADTTELAPTNSTTTVTATIATTAPVITISMAATTTTIARIKNLETVNTTTEAATIAPEEPSKVTMQPSKSTATLAPPTTTEPTNTTETTNTTTTTVAETTATTTDPSTTTTEPSTTTVAETTSTTVTEPSTATVTEPSTTTTEPSTTTTEPSTTITELTTTTTEPSTTTTEPTTTTTEPTTTTTEPTTTTTEPTTTTTEPSTTTTTEPTNTTVTEPSTTTTEPTATNTEPSTTTTTELTTTTTTELTTTTTEPTTTTTEPTTTTTEPTNTTTEPSTTTTQTRNTTTEPSTTTTQTTNTTVTEPTTTTTEPSTTITTQTTTTTTQTTTTTTEPTTTTTQTTTTTTEPTTTTTQTTTTTAADPTTTEDTMSTTTSTSTSIPTSTSTVTEAREYCATNPDACLTVVNNDVTKDQCEQLLAQQGYADKLKNAVKAEVQNVIQSRIVSVSVWCGSIIIQIIVGSYAAKLQEHYSSNKLVIQIDDETLSFDPETTTTTTSPKSTTTTQPEPTAVTPAGTDPIGAPSGGLIPPELVWIVAVALIGLVVIFVIIASILKLKGRPRSDSNSSNASGVRVVVGQKNEGVEMTSMDVMSASHEQSTFLTPDGQTDTTALLNPTTSEAPADSEIAAIEAKISKMSPVFRRVPTWASMRRMLEDHPDNIATFKRHISEAAIIVDYQVLPLIDNFVIFMRNHGTAAQKALYSSLDYAEVLDRLIIKRPAVFLNAGDSYVLKSTETGQSGFETIGEDEETGELKLESLMCYDEIAIAALLSMGGPTQFLNTGNRYNDGYWINDDNHVEEGIYVGCVGARFERPLQMEWRHMIVEEFQNTAKKGYGPNAKGPVATMLRSWAKLYGVAHFPLWSDVHQEGVTPDTHVQNRYWLIPEHEDRGAVYFDSHVYRARMRLVIAPFLCYADEEASKRKTKAYVHVVGLGLGAWLVHKSQPQEQVEIFAEILRSERFQYIADIDFSWFANVTSCGGRKNGELVGGVKIHFSKRDPADPLTGEHANKLLVAQYAWDGNAFPGNEYWTGLLNASGDPAAAASSTIGLIHNCEFNTGLTSDAVRTYEFPGYVSRGGPYTYKDKLHIKGNGCDAYHSSMQGYRQNQEDAHSMHPIIPELPGCSLFAVLDGHGGDQISFHGGNILLEHVTKFITASDLSPEATAKGLEQAYMDVDEHLKELTNVDTEKSGCTAVTALVTPEHIIVANCGDSRCVLSRNSEAIALSEDQKATSPVEVERIKKAGGVVFMKRVNGDLAVARAFGDWRFKLNDTIPAAEQMVSAFPVVTPIVRSDDDDFLILACDGVWDVMSNEDAVRFVCERLANNEEPDDVADALLDMCLKKRSRDNMTVIIVLLNVDKEKTAKATKTRTDTVGSTMDSGYV